MIKIVKPSSEYIESYYEACVETKGHLHDDYIMHNPETYDTWKDTILQDYENRENGIGLPEGFLPSATRWIVDGKKYIGTINMRESTDDILMQWGGTIGIVIRYSERKKGLSYKTLELIGFQKDLYDYLKDDIVVATIECSNTPSIKMAESLGVPFASKEKYVANIKGANVEALRIIFNKNDFFKGAVNCRIKDISLCDKGKISIGRAIDNMPVMSVITDRLGYEKEFKGLKIALCSHITKETAVACIALKEAGADVMMVSSNPRSTQDDVAAALVMYYGISVLGHSEQTNDEWVEFRERIFSFEPDILLDDGAEILPMLYEQKPELAKKLIGTTEQTTSGVNKVINMDKAGILKHPVIGVNSSKIKHLFDNHFGVGQTSATSILQITNVLIATETIVVIGYGPVGKGIAQDMKGLGGHVIVCETNPIRALEAYMDGHSVMSLEEAAEYGTVFITATGSCDVIPLDIIRKMKNGAILSNCGSGQIEFDFKGIEEIAVSHETVRPYMEKYVLPDGKYVFALTEGRVTNLVGGEGNPATVMDLSFSAITLAVEYLIKNKDTLEDKMYVMPEEVDKAIAKIKLNEFGIKCNKPTQKQLEYDNNWRK